MLNRPKHGAAVGLQQFAPHVDQAGHIGAHGRLLGPDLGADLGQPGLDVHGTVAAQGGEAAVHLGAEAAGAGAVGHRRRPDAGLGKVSARYSAIASVSQMARSSCTSTGTCARGRQRAQRALELRIGREAVEAHHDLVKGDAQLAHRHPGAHGPGRVVLVADVKLQHRRSVLRTM